MKKIQLRLCLIMLIAVIVAGLPGLMAQAQSTPASAIVKVIRAFAYGGPGRGFWIVATLRRNTIVPVLGVSADKAFWQVRTANGVGYVSAGEVTASNAGGVPVIDPGPIGSITAGNAAVRSGPGIEARQIATLGRGSQFYVIGRQPDGSWIEIGFRFGTGWVAAVVTNLGGSPTLGGVAPTTGGPVAIVKAEFLNLRSGPGVQYTSVGTVNRGDQFAIVGKSSGGVWLLLQTPFGVAWANIIYLNTRDYFGNAPVVSPFETGAILAVSATARTSVNVRTGPNLAFDSLGSITTGTEVTILGQSPDLAWWYVNTPIGKGWVSKAVIRVVGPLSGIPIVR
jgi:uncharacterized protein YgiM (DUF1202 family)